MRNDKFHGRVQGSGRVCNAPGCNEPGEFRAPGGGGQGFDGQGEWRWLCLDHVREFNAGYNFFEGMSADQIIEAQSPTAGWETESRAFRAAGSADLPPRWADFRDPIDALGARFRQRMDEARRQAADPRFTSLANRLKNVEHYYAMLAEICATRTNAEWVALLGKSNVPHGPVNTLDDLFVDPQLEATGFWKEVDHPTEGRLRMTDIPPRFSIAGHLIRDLVARLQAAP